MRHGYYTPEESRLRIVVVVLTIALVVFGIVAVNKCSNPSNNYGSGLYAYWDDPDQEEEGEDPDDTTETQQKNLRETLSRVLEEPLTMDIRAGERYEDCYLRNRPELQELKNKGLGGAKILAETGADANGDYKSSPTEDESCICPKPEVVGIGLDDSDSGIPNRIKRGEISVNSTPIDSRGGVSGWYSIFGLYITIENLTSREIDVTIRQGLLLETLGDNIQNIVVKQTVAVRLKSYEKKTVRVLAYCASHHRTSPVGYDIRFTPFYLLANESVYRSQEAVWQWQENWYASFRDMMY